MAGSAGTTSCGAEKPLHMVSKSVLRPSAAGLFDPLPVCIVSPLSSRPAKKSEFSLRKLSRPRSAPGKLSMFAVAEI